MYIIRTKQNTEEIVSELLEVVEKTGIPYNKLRRAFISKADIRQITGNDFEVIKTNFKSGFIPKLLDFKDLTIEQRKEVQRQIILMQEGEKEEAPIGVDKVDKARLENFKQFLRENGAIDKYQSCVRKLHTSIQNVVKTYDPKLYLKPVMKLENTKYKDIIYWNELDNKWQNENW